ncbi:MAG: hypothetical protein F6K31_29260, partial [Symploca sp. SIO2G7]|nr:hypothetical protein [Symploca sp. SIO2G7]
MNHTCSNLGKQLNSRDDSKQDSKAYNQTHQLNNNLKKIISLSAGCTLFTGLANAQSPVVYGCNALDDGTKADCQTTTKHDVDEKVKNLNSPSVQHNLNVQWSTTSRDSANQPILVSDGSAMVDKSDISHPESSDTGHSESDASHLESSDTGRSESDAGHPESAKDSNKDSRPSQNTQESKLDPLPTSTQIYGNTIDLNEDPSILDASSQNLRIGDRGKTVRILQEKLNKAGFTTKVDGIFGKDTKQAVRGFQKSQNLSPDGIVGPETSALLLGNVAPDTLSPTAGVPKSKTGIQNIATASSQQTGFINDDANVSVVSAPAVGINKSITQVSNPDGSPDDDGVIDQAGDMIKYSIKVKNAGNVTLTGVTVDDPLTSGILMANGTLPVGDEQTFNVTYTVTQSDIDNNGAGLGLGLGSIDNEATVGSRQTSMKRDSEAVPVQQTPALRVNKNVVGIDTKNDGRLDREGDIIEYVIEVENTGNQTLTNVSVDDPQLGKRVLNQLAPGEIQNFTARYGLTQADIDSNGDGDGDIDNTVKVITDQTGAVEDFAEVPVEQNPDITVEKRVIEQDKNGDGTLNNAGETITYEVIVTNTGNQTLTNVSIQDSLLSSWIVRDLTLAPGASDSYT